MWNNAVYLPENPIVYIILPKSIRNRASFPIFALPMLPTKIDIYIRMYKIEHIIIHSDLFHLTVSGYICKYIKTYD